jgi:hypothetical protein
MSNKDDSIIIDLSRARSKGNSNRYYCSYCNTRLVALTQKDMEGGIFVPNVSSLIGPISNQLRSLIALKHLDLTLTNMGTLLEIRLFLLQYWRIFITKFILLHTNNGSYQQHMKH